MSSDVYAWIVIGAAASLAGMIYPFKRGTTGVLLNLFIGVAGSVIFGLFGSWLLHAAPGQRRFWSMLLAAVGAFATIVLVHAAYSRRLAAKQTPPRPTTPPFGT